MSKLGVRNGTSCAISSIATLIGNTIASALVDACDGKFLGVQAIDTVLRAVTRTALVGRELLMKIWSALDSTPWQA